MDLECPPGVVHLNNLLRRPLPHCLEDFIRSTIKVFVKPIPLGCTVHRIPAFSQRLLQTLGASLTENLQGHRRVISPAKVSIPPHRLVAICPEAPEGKM